MRAKGRPCIWHGHIDETCGVVHQFAGQGGLSVSWELGNEPCWCPTAKSKGALNKHPSVLFLVHPLISMDVPM